MSIEEPRWKISSDGGTIPYASIPCPGSYLVTGASGVLGSQVCKALLEHKEVTEVYAVGRNLEKLVQLADSLRESVGRFPTPVALDWELRGANQTIEVDSNLVGVVHCAGSYGAIGELASVDVEDWESSISGQLIGALNSIRLAETFSYDNHMAAVLLAGGGASRAYRGLSAYSIAKTSIVRMVETAAREIDPRNLSINALGPGPTNSPMVDVVLANRKVVDEDLVRASELLASSSPDHRESRFVSSVLWLLSARGRKLSGRFLSAQWDDWCSIDDELDLSEDSYTLRRVFS